MLLSFSEFPQSDNLSRLVAGILRINDYNSQLFYLKNGLAYADFELSYLFRYYNFVVLDLSLDNSFLVIPFYNTARIDIGFSSTALDVDNGGCVEELISIEYDNTPTWITFSWAETGLYTGAISLIVNGEIIKEVNITNTFYQSWKNMYSSNFFEAVQYYNKVFASDSEGAWEPNVYYLNYAHSVNITPSDFDEVQDNFLNHIHAVYYLDDDEVETIRNMHDFFVDTITMFVDFHGDIPYDVNFVYGGERRFISPLNDYAYRVSNIYYINGANMSGASVGFEGMRSFAVAKDNVTRDDLRYWLDKKPLYSPGLMKAAYGTFLSALLVIYESDRVADEAASMFNVTWSRVSPTCVSFCNDFNSAYVTGESNHDLGRDAVGDSSGVWNFNFVTGFSFSLIEQIVINNIWGTIEIGSVTLGLLQDYLSNDTLEIFYSDGHIFIKSINDNHTLWYLDVETGLVHDIHLGDEISGLKFCYHDELTDNAWEYGNQLADDNSSSVIDYILEEIDIYLDSDSYDFFMGIAGSCLISMGVLMLVSNPIGWVTLGAIGIAAIGTTLLWYSNDLNKGLTAERMLNFCLDFGLAVVPLGGATFQIGKTTLLKPLSGEIVTTMINKNSKNIPYEIQMMENMGVSGTLITGYNTYTLYSQSEAIINNLFGFSPIEKGLKFFANLIKDYLIDYVTDNYYFNN